MKVRRKYEQRYLDHNGNHDKTGLVPAGTDPRRIVIAVQLSNSASAAESTGPEV